MTSLKKSTITEVIRYCNRDIVPDESFNAAVDYPSNWFVDYFDFIGDDKLQRQLGDAYYQARFLYKLMCGLQLPLNKQRGVVKFQIVQYASICEAVLDMALTKYYKEEAEERFSVVELKNEPSALAKDIRIAKGNTQLFICSEKKKKGVLKRTRIDFRTTFAVEKGILTNDLKNRLDILYDLRNNIHIIKAAEAEYNPKLREAKDGFELMREVVSYIKAYYQSHPIEQ